MKSRKGKGDNVMEFGIGDRLALLSMVPTQGTLTSLRLVRKFREELGFSEEDHEKLNLRVEGKAYRWDDAPAEEFGTKEIGVGKVLRDLILETFTALDSTGKLQLFQVDLYERFILENQKDGSSKEDPVVPIRS